MADYLSIAALEPYVLEESWVLGVVVSPGVVALEVDLCFSASNPELRPPRDGEYAYFRRGFIRFTGVVSVRWDGMGLPPAVDATGERDWGHIDVLEWSETTYRVEGDFGALELDAAAFQVALTEPA